MADWRQQYYVSVILGITESVAMYVIICHRNSLLICYNFYLWAEDPEFKPRDLLSWRKSFWESRHFSQTRVCCEPVTVTEKSSLCVALSSILSSESFLNARRAGSISTGYCKVERKDTCWRNKIPNACKNFDLAIISDNVKSKALRSSSFLIHKKTIWSFYNLHLQPHSAMRVVSKFIILLQYARAQCITTDP
jgi:hypothetical protein